MIKARNYITITIVIAIIFFLFASQGMARLTLSDKGVNHHALTLSEKYQKGNVTTGQQSSFIYAGEDADLKRISGEYAMLRGSSIEYTADLSEAASHCRYNTLVLVDGNIVDAASVTALEEILHRNATIVFLTMPDRGLLGRTPELKRLMGIQRDRGSIHLKGYQMLEGFMLGGDAYYVEDNDKSADDGVSRQDLPLDIAYYEVAASSRLYMIGQIDPEEQGIKDLDNDNTKGMDSEDYPAVIWQHAMSHGRTFVINGDFMKTDAGLGILSGIEYETLDVMISRFADARSLVAVGFPDLADENEESIHTMYGQSLYNFEKNIIWPFIVSAAAVNNDRLTLMSTDHIQSGTGEYSREDTWLTLAENERAEMGVMGDSAEDVKNGLAGVFPDYSIRSYYGSGSGGVVVTDEDSDSDGDVFSQTGDTLGIKKTEDADEMSFSDDLRLRSIVTAAGYYLSALDVTKMIYPDGKDSRYENMSRRATGNLSTYYGRFRFLTPLTLSETGTRISEFLNTDISVSDYSSNNRMVITVRSGSCSRLLVRTHDQDIVSVDGGTAEKAEDDSYILTVSGRRAVIHLADTDHPTLLEK